MVAEGKTVDDIYLDSSKAFDSVFHRALLEALAAGGLDWNIPHWVKTSLGS